MPPRNRRVRFHRSMLGARRSICFLNDHLCLLETLLYIAMPDAKAMANIGAFLGTYAEVGSIVVRDGMMFMHKWCSFRHCLDSIEHSWKSLVLYINQVESLIGFLFRRRSNSHHRIAHKTYTVTGQHRLILNLTTVAAKVTDIIWCKHDNGIGDS